MLYQLSYLAGTGGKPEYSKRALPIGRGVVANAAGMTTRTLTLPTQLARWLVPPAVFGALCAAALSLIRARTRPSLPRMSDEWLHSLDRGTGREFDTWR